MSTSPLKTTLNLSYLLAIFVNLIFNQVNNRSIVSFFLCFSLQMLPGMLLLIALYLKYFRMTLLS